MNDKQKKIAGKYILNCAVDGFVNGAVCGIVIRAIPQLRIPAVLCSVGYGVYKYTKRTDKFQRDFTRAAFFTL